MTTQYWKSKICLVTGGSSGIGLALGEQLAAAGAHVWIIARDPKKLEAALERINARRANQTQICGMAPADVSQFSEVQQAIRLVYGNVGLPDVLINSAGVVRPGYFQDIPIEQFQRDMEINYLGVVHTTHVLAPEMMARRSGHIINICSGAGFFGTFGYTSYGATKFALAGFTDALRSELKPYGVRTSIVYPNDVDTPGLQEEIPQRPFETSAIAGTAKIGKVDEVARQILRRAVRGDYMIFPGGDTLFWYIAVSITGSLRYKIVDWIVADAQRKQKLSK